MIMAFLLPSLLLVFTILCVGIIFATAAEVEIDPTGGQSYQQQQQRRRPNQIHATFINSFDRPVNLYWAGNINSLNERSLQMYYGPVEANGGQRSIDAFEGQIFVLTEMGGYERLGEYLLGTSSTASSGKETFDLTPENAMNLEDRRSKMEELEVTRSEENANKCRSLIKTSAAASFLDRCQSCAYVNGCGYSLVRDACFVSHTTATINHVTECNEINSIKENDIPQISATAWLNRAAGITLANKAHPGSTALRMAYVHVEKAVEKSGQALKKARDKNDEYLAKGAEATVKKAKVALVEMAAKLEAVFDDLDAKELLESSRHPKLAEVHPDMKSVPRRTKEEAIEYVLRGEPVVITNMFEEGNSNPVVHEWTLDYLNQKVFGTTAVAEAGGTPVPKFNVAADMSTRCCRYFEPQGKAQSAGYPYPFQPTTHLYRDTFDGFVKTVQKSNRDVIGQDDSSAKPRLLHYLHEIVMNRDGEAVVAGGKAPQQLTEDLAAVTSQLKPLAAKQPFFGDFSFAKVWMGQKGIVMPMHYDATDNLYVMAWGRKRAIIGKPGQLDALYRYPNGHPLVGSSQVNLTEPDLELFPHFKDAELHEVVVGPGDVLYLPAWWWHQFEQPFEDTAALNLWSKDREEAPEPHTRDTRVREHLLADKLEESIAQNNARDAGVIFDALANGKDSSYYVALREQYLDKKREGMISAVHQWQYEMSQLPGGDPMNRDDGLANEIVNKHLDRTHRNVMRKVVQTEWSPGDSWDLAQAAKLPRALRDRCEAAPESSPFMSICG